MTKLVRERCDIAVVGAGPGGIAAASHAAEQGAKVMLVDARAHLGGQIWRGPLPPRARQWCARARGAGVQHCAAVEVVDAARTRGGGFRLYCQGTTTPGTGPEAQPAPSVHTTRIIESERLVLATGATERALPIPGANTPQVSGVGGVQALVKAGLNLRGKRVGVMGSGPLLWAVAATLHRHGAQVAMLVEQAAASQVARLSRAVALRPALWRQGAALRWRVRNTRVRLGAWPVRVEQLAARQEAHAQIRVHVQDERGATETLVLDHLACAFGLVPETGLAERLRARIHELGPHERGVVVGPDQQCSIPGLYAVGECTGVGGVQLALAEGMVAGAHAGAMGRAVGNAARLAAKRDKQAKWAAQLRAAFALRPELLARVLAASEGEPGSIICPCEGVSTARLCQLRRCSAQESDSTSARTAKLLTRAGMGACQGRVCAPALEALLDWRPAAGRRAPLVPVRVGTLAALWADART